MKEKLLLFKSLRYSEKKVTIQNAGPLTIGLGASLQNLKEVVVVSYGILTAK